MGLFGPNRDRAGYQEEWRDKSDVAGTLAPVADPTASGYTARAHLGIHGQVLFGKVVDGVAYTHAYRVTFEGAHPPIVAVLSGLTSLLPVGARQANSIVPGCCVWCIVHPQLNYGVILAVEPDPIIDPTRALSDWIHQASRCGLRVDGIHNAVFTLNKNGGVTDWSSGRPFDGTLGGEWGAITETGLRVIIDSYMAQLAVDEATGVFAFYHDQLLRVAGYNLQSSSAGHEHEWLDDQGEILIYQGETPYPWEQMGALAPGIDPLRELSPQDCQIDQPHYAHLEPQTDTQQAFHRVLRLGGYVGQGSKRLILIPPTGGNLYTYGSGGAPPAAVFEEQTTLSGRYALRAAKGITIAKRIAIPGPRRVIRPESPTGDTPANYKAASQQGSGPAHKITAGVRTTDDEYPQLQQAAAAADAHAHTMNWEGEVGLHYHKEDWDLPDEADTPQEMNQEPINFGALGGSFYLERPEARPLKVDHRYGNVDYFPNESYLSLLDDGGVVLGDGYGAEIRLSGGHIFLTAPGDIWTLPGRNANILAGYDAIVRAKHGIDLSATEQDVRVKAEHNVQILAGNDKALGAVLIESRAPAAYNYKDKVGEDVQAGGIQLKTAKGDLTCWAANIYLRTGGGDVQPGTITLDAAKGQQPITTYSSEFIRYVTVDYHDNFGSEGNITASNVFEAKTTILAGGLVTGDFVLVTAGGMLVEGDIEVTDGHIFTEKANDYQNIVPKPDDRSLELAHRSIEQGLDDIEENRLAAGNYFQSEFAQFWYGPNRPGEDATITAVGFSFRNKGQYRTGDFGLFEARWQQLARVASGGAPATWTEKPVQAGSTVTYPYPGKEKWVDEATYREQDLVLVDAENGVSSSRDESTYGDPEFAAPTKQAPDGVYAVII
jgi:hypothetical protein